MGTFLKVPPYIANEYGDVPLGATLYYKIGKNMGTSHSGTPYNKLIECPRMERPRITNKCKGE
jgi:hypothetical protein